MAEQPAFNRSTVGPIPRAPTIDGSASCYNRHAGVALGDVEIIQDRQ